MGKLDFTDEKDKSTHYGIVFIVLSTLPLFLIFIIFFFGFVTITAMAEKRGGIQTVINDSSENKNDQKESLLNYNNEEEENDYHESLLNFDEDLETQDNFQEDFNVINNKENDNNDQHSRESFKVQIKEDKNYSTDDRIAELDSDDDIKPKKYHPLEIGN
jgi:hypothetical protein